MTEQLIRGLLKAPLNWIHTFDKATDTHIFTDPFTGKEKSVGTRDAVVAMSYKRTIGTGALEEKDRE